VKRCSTSLIIREMQIQITRYYFTPTGMSIIKKLGAPRWHKCGEIRTLIYSWWECKMGQLFWKTV
ncbi:LORF2 protein, partial [Crocuta crocuta]